MMKLFLRIRGNAMYFFIALASTMIIISSFTISLLYIEDTINRILQETPYHAIICFKDNYNRGVESLKLVEEILESEDISSNYAFYITGSIIRGTIEVNGSGIGRVVFYTVYLPGLDRNYVETHGSSKPVNGVLNLTLGPYSIEALGFRHDPRNSGYVAFIESMGKTLGRIIKDKELLDEKVEYIHDLILEAINPGYLSSKYNGYVIMVFYTGSRKSLEKTIEVSEKYGEPVYTMVNVFDLSSGYKVNRILSYNSIVVSIIFFNTEKALLPYSIDASRNNVEKIIDKIYSTASMKGFDTGLLDSRLYDELNRLSGVELITRISITASLLPAFAIIWITSSMTTPLVMTPIKRILALLRIRGIPLNKVYPGYISSITLYAVAGSLVGVFVGPIPAIYSYNAVGEYWNILLGLIDPYSVSLIVGIVLTLLTASIHSGVKILRKTTPLEYYRATGTGSIVKGGIDRLTAILLALSIYFIIRVFNLVNPYSLAYGRTKPLISILVALLFILEPVVMFFGPVILIYTVARILARNPWIIGGFSSRISSILLGRLRILTYRFTMYKSDKIILPAIAYGFALSLLILGLLGSASTPPLFEKIDYSMSGGVDYVLYRYVVLNHSINLDSYALEELDRINGYINGSKTYGFLYLGETPARREEMLIGGSIVIDGKRIDYGMGYMLDNTSIHYILYIPEGFDKTVYYGENMFYDNRKGDELIIVSKPYWEKTVLYVRENGERIPVEEVEKPVYARNMPCPLCFYATASSLIGGFEIEYAEYAPDTVVYVFYPSSIGVIASTKLYHRLTSIYNDSRSVFVYYVFVHGEVDPTALTRLGYSVYSLSIYREYTYRASEYFTMSFNVNTMTGLALYVFSTIILLETIYASISEDYKSYAVLDSRGIGSKSILKIMLSQSFSTYIVCMIPGLILGLTLAYSLPSTILSAMPRVAEKLVEKYGVVYTVYYTPGSIVALASAISIPLVITLLESYILYKIFKEYRLVYLRW